MARLFVWWRMWSAPAAATAPPATTATLRVFCTGRWYGTIEVTA